VPQAHSRGGQSAERSWRREIEQQLEKVEEELWRLHCCPPWLLNALCLCDETFRHASEARDHHEGYAGYTPSQIAATTLEVPPGDTQAGDRDHWSDDVATPVHNVEDGTFDRGGLLTLDGLAELWGSSEVLGSRGKWRKEIAEENQSQRHLEDNLNPIDLIGTMKNERGC
jgi:hypothetical protein